MSLRYRLVLPVILSALAVLAGCGSSSPKTTPPPTGGFGNSNLNGTYVFSVTGSDTNFNFLTIAGTFTANGSGGITGGVMDLNGNTNGPITNQAITRGSYSVGADGRPASQGGLLTLSFAGGGSVSFDYVLTSKEHGLITEFDNNGTGSGTLDLQANVTQANIDGQSYAFNLTGTSGIGTTICGVNFGGANVPIPFATVGAVTLDSSGNVSTGVEDFNNNCSSAGLAALPFTGGSVSLASVPGVASFTTSAGTFNFDVFPVDVTHLKLIETDASAAALSGDAFTQSSSFPTGNNVFSLAGFDNTSTGGSFAAAGIIATDGSGNITASSVEDVNDGGVSTEVAANIAGTYTAPSGGRSTLTFTSAFINGNGGLGCSGCTFAAYPSTAGVQILEIDNGGTTDGTLYPPSNGPTLASAQGYGLDLSGSTVNSPEDDIVEFTNNNGTLGPGIIDFNDVTIQLHFDQKFQATYAADSSVSGRGIVTPVTNAYSLVTYGVDNSTQVVVSVDPNFVGLGFLVEQNATAKSNAAISHLAVLRLGSAAQRAMKKHAGR